ncbi:unnamed protein product, partial [Musa textilis]
RRQAAFAGGLPSGAPAGCLQGSTYGLAREQGCRRALRPCVEALTLGAHARGPV